MTVRVIGGDCIAEMAALVSKGIAVDAIVTDPPYHLAPMDKRHLGREIDKAGGYFRSLSTGFMNKTWDGGDVAFRTETWSAAYDALKPGGYLLAFGGTRTHHRIWCAIEDAGFVIQDTIMWLYGQGFPKGHTQLKPAFEPICVAYKPGSKRTLQVDECRILADSLNARDSKGGKTFSGGYKPDLAWTGNVGRWPANLCHDGSAEVMEAFAAFGESKSAGHHPKQRNGRSMWADKGGGLNGNSGPEAWTDTGTPARYFYCAKASKTDRAGSKHPTVKPIALMRWLVRLVTPPGGLVLDLFAGSGTTGAAALAEGRNAILIEREPEYIADIRRRMNSSRRAVARAADEATAAQHAA